MRALAAFAGGLLVGAVLVARLKPAPESSCCARVAAGVRAEVGELCGPLGEFCQQAGDSTGLFKIAPGLLDFFGIET